MIKARKLPQAIIRIEAQRDDCLRVLGEHAGRIDELERENARLRKVVEEVEWVLDANYQEGCACECAWCQGKETSGHYSHCARQLALGKETPQTCEVKE